MDILHIHGWGGSMGIENIDNTRYDESTNTLRVVYKGGSVIEYKPIDAEAYTAMISAESLHRAVHSLTRLGTVVGTRRNEG